MGWLGGPGAKVDPLWLAHGTMGHRGTLPGHKISFSLVLSSQLKLYIIHPFGQKHGAFYGGGCWKKVKSESRSVVSDSLRPHDYTVHEIFQARILGWVAFPSLADLPNPGIKQRCPALQVDSLPTELLGKQKEHIKSI